MHSENVWDIFNAVTRLNGRGCLYYTGGESGHHSANFNIPSVQQFYKKVQSIP